MKMAFDPGALDSTLAAAVGDDPMLVAELRAVFVDSAQEALIGMHAAITPDDWSDAALRLRGLAASFGALRLMAAAGEAADGTPGDATLLRRMERIISAF